MCGWGHVHNFNLMLCSCAGSIAYADDDILQACAEEKACPAIMVLPGLDLVALVKNFFAIRFSLENEITLMCSHDSTDAEQAQVCLISLHA